MRLNNAEAVIGFVVWLVARREKIDAGSVVGSKVLMGLFATYSRANQLDNLRAGWDLAEIVKDSGRINMPKQTKKLIEMIPMDHQVKQYKTKSDHERDKLYVICPYCAAEVEVGDDFPRLNQQCPVCPAVHGMGGLSWLVEDTVKADLSREQTANGGGSNG